MCCKIFKNKNIDIYEIITQHLMTTIRDYIHVKDLAIIHKKIVPEIGKSLKILH